LVLAKVRERVAVSKQPVQKMDKERYNLKKLNEEEVIEKISGYNENKCSALENFENNGDINRAWDTIRENIKISAKESMGH
jgi:hypothetical protein